MSQNDSGTLTVDSPLVQIRLRNVSAALEQELALARPFLLQSCGDTLELIALDVVEHDDVCASVDRLVRLRLGLHLDLEQQRKAADLAGLLDRGCN